MSRTLYHTLVSNALSNHGKALAISADANNNGVYVRALDYKDDLQYWELRPTRGGNGVAIINKARGMCIARNGLHNGSPLMLVGVEQIETNDKAVWRLETALPSYNAINSFADFEQKINIPGNGPYTDGQALITWEWSNRAPNELWMDVHDMSKVKVKSVDFNLEQGNIQDQEPLIAGTQTLINKSSLEQTQTLTFRFLQSHTYGFHREKGLEVTEAIEFKGGLPGLGETKLKIEVKGTWKWSTSEEHSDEQEVVVEVPVRIPPESAMRVSVVVLRARLDVPYNAVLTYEFTDGSKVDRSSSGFFSGVNGYNVTTKFEDLGKVAQHLKMRRFDRLAGGVLGNHTPAANAPALEASGGSAE